jgi:FemAB family protein
MEIKQKVEHENLWITAFEALSYQPYLLVTDVIEYFRSVLESENGQCFDRSLIILRNDVPIAVWCVLESKNIEGITSISCSSFPIAPPSFLPDVSEKEKRKINQAIVDCLSEYTSSGKVEISSEFPPKLGLGDWHKKLCAAFHHPKVRHNLAINLDVSFEELRKNFRKSYKPLINRALETWCYQTIGSEDLTTDLWAEFHKFHVFVAGRETRTHSSWMQQYSLVDRDSAFLVTLRDENTAKLVGAGLFSHSRDECMYSTGVYDRELFHLPLGHLVQNLAIQEMQGRKIKWYRIGARQFENDAPSASLKEISISKFKQGFATHLFPDFIFDSPLAVEGNSD